MTFDLRQDTVPVEVFRKQLAKKEKLIADLRPFKNEQGAIVGWEAPAFKAGYTFPAGIAFHDEAEAKTWLVARVADGSFDWLLAGETKRPAGAAKRPPRRRRLVNPAKYRTDRDLERAIEEKKHEIIELEAKRQQQIAQGGPDKLSGVIAKSRAYLEELQVLRSGLRGKF